MATPGGGLVKRTPEQVQAQNLMILQRKDEAVSEILATATYVVIYVFEPKGKQWERKEIEGSLFIVKRSFGVRFRLVVLNRVNPTDLEQDLTGSFTFEDMSPYLLYRTNADGADGGAGKVETLAIWFHNEKDKANIANCLRKVLRLQAGATDQQQQAERQERTHQALLEPSSMLPASPPPGSEAGGAAPATAEAPSGKPVSSIEEMLLKAARVSSSSAPAPAPAAPQQPQQSSGVMNMLLRPQALAGGASSSAPAPAPATGLLNPMALAAAAKQQQQQQQQPGNGAAGVVLDKAQFKATLLGLLEEEDGFVESLHQAYLRKVRK